MRLLIVRGDLQSHSGYSAAIRDYCTLLQPYFDRIAGVDIHFSPDRPYQRFPHSLLVEDAAQAMARQAGQTLVLSCTTPNHYAAYEGAVNVGLTFWETDRLPIANLSEKSWTGMANSMHAIWAPSTDTRRAFENAGVVVPIRVIPWPIQPPSHQQAGLPDGEAYDLDRAPFPLRILARVAQSSAQSRRLPRWLRERIGKSAADKSLAALRITETAVEGPTEPYVLCVAQSVPRKGLWLFLAEWMEFRRRRPAMPWQLLVKSTPIDPATPKIEFVTGFWRQVQSLKRQLAVRTANVQLWPGSLSPQAYEQLFMSAFALAVPSLGEGFCGPAAMALALARPVIAPSHTALADYITPEYPYSFASRPARVTFIRDPLRIYDPASIWHVPEPFAIAEALARLADDPPEKRMEACRAAADKCLAWCSPRSVAVQVEAELRRLFRPCAQARAA